MDHLYYIQKLAPYPSQSKPKLDKWDARFIELAKLVASWSKDTTKVGAVITDGHNKVLGMGYNGFASGINDNPERYEDREYKLKRVLHAEENAFLNSSGHGHTIYTTLFPCSGCARYMVQHGIKRVVTPAPFDGRWKESFDAAISMFEEVRIGVEYYDPL